MAAQARSPRLECVRIESPRLECAALTRLRRKATPRHSPTSRPHQPLHKPLNIAAVKDRIAILVEHAHQDRILAHGQQLIDEQPNVEVLRVALIRHAVGVTVPTLPTPRQITRAAR